MKENPLEDGLLRRYFLEELPEEEADEIERRLLSDSETFRLAEGVEADLLELAEAVEADLVAAAARGELAPAERERILKRLASSPQGRERLALARALNKAADEEKAAVPNVARFPRRAPVSRQTVQWLTAVAASLLIVTGLTWYVMQKDNVIEAQNPVATNQQAQGNRNVPPKAPEKQPVAAPVQPAPVPDEVARKEEPPVTEPVKRLGRAVLQLALTNRREVAGEPGKLPLTPDLGVVEIQLDADEYQGFESYNVTLRKEQETIWEKKGLKLQQLDWTTALVLEVPAARLEAGGRYEVQAQGVTAEGEPQPP
jgi:hypothetical protein